MLSKVLRASSLTPDLARLHTDNETRQQAGEILDNHKGEVGSRLEVKWTLLQMQKWEWTLWGDVREATSLGKWDSRVGKIREDSDRPSSVDFKYQAKGRKLLRNDEDSILLEPCYIKCGLMGRGRPQGLWVLVFWIKLLWTQELLVSINTGMVNVERDNRLHLYRYYFKFKNYDLILARSKDIWKRSSCAKISSL